MTATAPSSVEEMMITINEEIHVRASLEATFAALLEELGPAAVSGDGSPMAMKVEAWPGGRWYRDLGSNNGHCWGFVQSIKRPTLLEFNGPLFMSYGVSNNIQYRLSEEPGGTLIKFRHSGFGLITPEHRSGVSHGWAQIHAKTVARAEAAKKA